MDGDGDCDDSSLVEVKASVEHIASHFRVPLEAKKVSLAALQDEIEEAVEYARMYLSSARQSIGKSGTNCFPAQMQKNGQTSSVCVSSHLAYHSLTAEWSRFSLP